MASRTIDNKHFLISIILVFLTSQGHAQNNSILIDFGNIPSLAPWNNISNHNSGSINGMIDAYGQKTNVSISVIDSFSYINTNGTQSPDPQLNLVSTASGDSFFGNTEVFENEVQTSGAIRISNLDTATLYTFKIFASRLASDNRETQYIIKGRDIDTSYLNVSDNNSEIIEISTYASQEGTVDIIASEGPRNNNTYGFFYLGVLVIEYEDKEIPKSLSIAYPNGGEHWQVGKEVDVVINSTTRQSAILEYSVDDGSNWSTIDTTNIFQNIYPWVIPDTPSKSCLLRVTSDSLRAVSSTHFEISGSQDSCKVVVIGSSTAQGVGASVPDSAWVNRFRYKSYQKDTRVIVENLARGGYTTYHILPTDNDRGEEVGISVDTLRNISKALSREPSAIIVNLPSNDAANFFSVEDQMTNFRLMEREATDKGIPIWVCTTQPRNFSNNAQIELQEIVRDSIINYFGSHTIDFWNDISDTDGRISPDLDSGDGVHLNDKGHLILSDKVLKANIADQACMRTNTGVSYNDNNEKLIQAQVCPNPYQTSLFLEIESYTSGKYDYSIIDATGKELFRSVSQNLKKGNQRVEMQPASWNVKVQQTNYLQLRCTTKNGIIEKVIPLIQL